jgi:hypothetical protein
MAISAVFAQVPIGKTIQPVPFESNPTVWTRFSTAMVVTNGPSTYDQDLSFFGQIRPAATTSVTGLWFQLATFTTPTPPEAFTPGWVDLKIKYEIPMGSDDMYRIEYQVAPSAAWNVLQPDTTTAFPAPAQIRPFPQIAEPNDGVWDWTDVSNIAVRVTYTKVGSYVLAQMTMNIYEVWATVYPDPLPPSASTALSVMPPVVFGVPENLGTTFTDNMFFVDVYAQGMTGMGAGLWGYQASIIYDTNVVSAVDFFSYWPFITSAPSGIDDTAGNVVVSYFTFAGDTVGFTGDMTPLARIYFSVDVGGGGRNTVLDLINDPPTLITELKPVGLGGFTPPLYDGYFSSPAHLSFTAGIFPGGDPIGTVWHEDYPIFSRTWTVTGWVDNGDSTLSPSDQLLIDVGGTVGEYHVDQVTITIHWTFKPTGEGAADPEDPASTPELPTDPIGTRWHQIYPDYCRTFTINSHTDNGNPGFDPSDQFDFEYDDEAGTVYDAHLDSVTTNILVSAKPGGGPVPEFPMGIGLIFAVAPLISIIYLWRTKARKKVA